MMVEKLKKWFGASIEKNGFNESVLVVQHYEVNKDLTVDFAIFVYNYLVGYCFKDLGLVLPSVKSSLHHGGFDMYIYNNYLFANEIFTSEVPNECKHGMIFMLFNNKTLAASSTLTNMTFDFRIKNYTAFDEYFNLYIEHQIENVRAKVQ
jgi:hypothetical protein